MSKERVFEIIEENKKDFEVMSDYVWDHPETCFHEYESSRYQSEYMAAQGFEIITPVAGMETGFIAIAGSGKPVIGILGENDALPNQVQVADYVGANPVTKGANGHACGHNLLGTGSIEAACALKKYFEENNIEGTIKYYACPAEEGGGGKVFMARDGVFDGTDVIFSWHPSDDNTLDNTALACVSFDLEFKGNAAHAAGEPWNGRSALDAVEILNIGVQFLREHVTPDVRIHYGYVDAGGSAPNVVQSYAKIRYCVRAAKASYMEEVYNRVIKCAEGAAHMTETTLEKPFIYSAYNDFLYNDPLDKQILKNMEAIVADIKYTPEEQAYAASFQAHGNKQDREYPIDREINWDLRKPARGSTDVADVSYCAPLSQFRVASCAIGSIGHGWTTTAQGKSTIAHKGMHAAAKIICATAIDLIENPELLEEATAFWKGMTKGGSYKTMMPDSLKPGDHKA